MLKYEEYNLKTIMLLLLFSISFSLFSQITLPNLPPPPPPPPPPPLQKPKVLKTKKTVIEEEKSYQTNPSLNQEQSKHNIFDKNDEEQPEFEEIFDIVEESASFPGGLEAMMEFLGRNTKYPDQALENGIQGRVYVQFVVYKDGSIKDVEVVNGSHEILNEEAVRVVKSMPKWVPGKQGGKSVNSRFTLPVKFRISSDSSSKNSN